MEVLALTPSPIAPVLMEVVGKGMIVGLVRIMKMNVTHFQKSIIVAKCDEDFCKNSGKCLFPYTNCSCPDGWEGAQCDTGNNGNYCL